MTGAALAAGAAPRVLLANPESDARQDAAREREGHDDGRQSLIGYGREGHDERVADRDLPSLG